MNGSWHNRWNLEAWLVILQLLGHTTCICCCAGDVPFLQASSLKIDMQIATRVPPTTPRMFGTAVNRDVVCCSGFPSSLQDDQEEGSTHWMFLCWMISSEVWAVWMWFPEESRAFCLYHSKNALAHTVSPLTRFFFPVNGGWIWPRPVGFFLQPLGSFETLYSESLKDSVSQSQH